MINPGSPYAKALAEALDAGRCLNRALEPAARLRPKAYWYSLPLGLDVMATMQLIEDLPEEPDDSCHEDQLRMLRDRFRVAEQTLNAIVARRSGVATLN